jgi:Cu(I)/Ag(I) efflux system membrane fusion protein
MKNNWRNNMQCAIEKTLKTFVMLIIMLGLIVSCNSEKEKQVHVHDEYTCPMHPQITQDKPGTCPICGMDLVKKSGDVQSVAVSDEMKDLIKPTNSSVIAAIETIRPERKSLPVNVTAPGVVSYDTRKTYSVPVRFGGRIEKLYLKYNYQPVRKGQVIMEIYSPELITAQRELLYVVSQHKEHIEIIESAKQKLQLLGLTNEQIENIINTGKESFAFPVFSPFSGYIVESNVSLPEASTASASSTSMGGGGMNKKSAGAMGGGAQPYNAMNTTNSSPAMGGQFSIREGMYVSTGQSLFKVVDGTRLWAELYFPAKEGAQIRKGVPIELHVKGTQETIRAKVDFIQPFFSEGKQFLQVRSYINTRANEIRVGQLVTAHVTRTHDQALWIPKKAVLDLGVQQIVFIKEKATYTPFKVKTGLEADGWIEITEGLDESVEIAVNAQYLVDSESFIKVINP